MNAYSPYLQWVDEQHESMANLLEKWANINSGTDNLTGLQQMLDALQRAFSPLEGKAETLILRPHIKISSKGHAIEIEHGRAFRMIKRPNAPLQVLLGGHMDTVYPSHSHFQSAKRLDNETLSGPGVADMKGGLVVMLTALQALERSPFASAVGWEVFISPDEEAGSPGSEPFLHQSARRNALGLLFEPAFPDGSLVSSRKGSANFTVVARGRAAHAGRDFHAGRNAIAALARFLVEAETLNDKDKGVTFNAGHIEGGGPVNIVPDLAICRFNIRMVHPGDLKLLREELNRIISKCHTEEGLTLTLYEQTVRPPKPFNNKDQALFYALYTCAEELGFPLLNKPSGGVSDGNILSAEGLPTIDTMGVVGGNIHTHEEYMSLASLTQRAKLTAYFLMKLGNQELDLVDSKGELR